MGVPEKQYIGRGACRKRGGGAFDGGWYPNAHYALSLTTITIIQYLIQYKPTKS